MQLDIHEAQGVTVLTPTGRITMGDGDVALRKAVYELLEAGARNILIDLGHVTFIDSFGIGQLMLYDRYEPGRPAQTVRPLPTCVLHYADHQTQYGLRSVQERGRSDGLVLRVNETTHSPLSIKATIYLIES